jgi:M6 family metalloprotease-like protein
MLDGFNDRGDPIREGRKMAARAIERAATQYGFDFSRYDANRDGTITTDELSILMIHAGPGDNQSASNRSSEPGRVRPFGSRVAVNAPLVAITGDGASFLTIAHELFHSLGAIWDLYGSGFHSQGLTLMSISPGGQGSFHLDPWYKMRLGWLAPRILPLNNLGDVLELTASHVQAREGPTSLTRRPLLLYDAARGPGEFFLVEFRSAAAGARSYDRDINDWRANRSGIAVWHAKVDEAHNPLAVPGIKITGEGNRRLDSIRMGDDVEVDSDGDGTFDRMDPGPDRELQSVPAGDDKYWNDNAVFMRGAPNGRRGDAALLQDTDGDMLVDWLRTPPEPSVLAFRIRAGRTPVDATKTWVEWSAREQLIPRIDWASTEGSPITLRGVFGVVQGAKVVSLHDDDLGTHDLEVASWTPQELVARVPPGVPPGRYELVVYTDATRRSQSNWHPFDVRP